jgi:hypothetical protein
MVSFYNIWAALHEGFVKFTELELKGGQRQSGDVEKKIDAGAAKHLAHRVDIAGGDAGCGTSTSSGSL